MAQYPNNYPYPPMYHPSYRAPTAAPLPPPPYHPPPPAAQPNYSTTYHSSNSYANYGYAYPYAHASACPPPVYPPEPAGIRPMPVVGPQYCLPHPVDLVIVRKLMTLTDDFTVTDMNKNVVFKEKGKLLTLHDRRVLLDAAGKPIITLRQKLLTAHSRWQVFRGDSSNPRDLIFSAKTSSVIQLKTKLNVYLSNRTSEDVCDFKVKGSWNKKSCVVYVGESTTVAAQMQKKGTLQSLFFGKDTFMVTVHPNIDYAFVVAIILILDAIKSASDVSMQVVTSTVF